MELEFIIQFPAHQPNLAHGTRSGADGSGVWTVWNGAFESASATTPGKGGGEEGQRRAVGRWS